MSANLEKGTFMAERIREFEFERNGNMVDGMALRRRYQQSRSEKIREFGNRISALRKPKSRDFSRTDSPLGESGSLDSGRVEPLQL